MFIALNQVFSSSLKSKAQKQSFWLQGFMGLASECWRYSGEWQ